MICFCPHCSSQYNIPDEKLGKTFKCSQCGKEFVAKAERKPVKEVDFFKELLIWFLFYFGVILSLGAVYESTKEVFVYDFRKWVVAIVVPVVSIIFLIKIARMFFAWLSKDDRE